MLSFGQIRDWAVAQLHEDTADALLTNLILRWVNEALGDVASTAQWKWLEDQHEFVFGGHGAGAATATGVTYMPHYVSRILDAFPTARGSVQPVVIIGAWEMDARSPSITGGDADFLVHYGYYGVERDNPTTGTILATAAGGAAGNGAICRVEGINGATGLEYFENITLAGAGTATTAGTFLLGPGGVKRCYVVDSSITGAIAPGIITFTRGGVVIERIDVALGERAHEHLRTELSPAPATGTATYLVRFYRRVRPMVAVTDMVDIPFEFENLLMMGLSRRLAEYQGRSDMALYHMQSFGKRVAELKAWQAREPGKLSGLKQVSRRAWRSRLS